MSEFSPFSAKTRDMELAATRSRRKPWRFPCARATTTARTAGGFRDRGLTLLRRAKTAIDAVSNKNR